MRIRSLTTLVLLIATTPPALADPPPACDRAGHGAVACLAGTLCSCVFDRGGAVTATPAGFRWDCGVLRPRCGLEAHPPAAITEHRGEAPAMPLAIGIERADRGATVKPDGD